MANDSMIFIGIDPGLTGAVAWLQGNTSHVWNIPTIQKGYGSVKTEIDTAGLFKHIVELSYGKQATCALERVNSMPGQAASSTFSLGDSFGSIRACVSAAGVPITYVTPQKWKKYFGLTSVKEEARAMAIKLYPTSELHLKKHIDRAEALLIATYLKQTYGSGNA